MLDESDDSESLPEPEPDVDELSRRFFNERERSCRAAGMGDAGFFRLAGGDGETRFSISRRAAAVSDKSREKMRKRKKKTKG